jgi:hypothetical protein
MCAGENGSNRGSIPVNPLPEQCVHLKFRAFNYFVKTIKKLQLPIKVIMLGKMGRSSSQKTQHAFHIHDGRKFWSKACQRETDKARYCYWSRSNSSEGMGVFMYM